MKKRIVLAFGGNALQKNGEVTAEAQKKIAEEVGEAIYELSSKYEIVIAHGNGPNPESPYVDSKNGTQNLMGMGILWGRSASDAT